MQSVDFMDTRLDPPDYPTRGECDHCGDEYSYDDLTRRGTPGSYEWLCDDCIEAEDRANDLDLDDDDMPF